MAPYAKLTTYPSLGQLTVIPSEQDAVCFTILVEWNKSRPRYPFELVLCYTSSSNASSPQSRWTSIPLTSSPGPSIIAPEDAFRSTFQIARSKAMMVSESDKTVHFTVKYRVNDSAPWQWVQTQQGTLPGQIVFQSPPVSSTTNCSDFLKISPGWTSTDVPGISNVYELRSDTPIPKFNTDGDQERLFTHVLGKVPGHLQYLALVRIEPYWLGPRQGKDYFHLNEDAILCAFLTKTGQVVTFVTFAELDNTYSVIQSNEDGEIVVAARCDSDRDNHFYVVASVSSNFEDSCSAIMNFVSRRVSSQTIQENQGKTVSQKSEKSDAKFDTWVDGLAFCTWNALGQDLTEDKILAALSSLADKKINISTLLIDDNWQRLGPIPGHDFSDSHFRGMADMPCNSDVAPEGLAVLVQKIKKAHPKITDIGVWHALMGYWAAISPSGQLAKDYETIQVPAYLMGNHPATLTSIAPSSIPKFYDDFYSYLSESGITFVKTDVQHMLSMFRTRSARRELVDTYQTAWTLAHNKHFHSKAISCMSQIPQTLYTSHMQTAASRIVLRNSDDFYPEVQASHPWHIWKNAHNALFTRHLNVLPDWDMFQTSHAYSSYHAAARCISGGPLLITDVPGEHDVALIQQMTALDKDGRSIALRPGMARAIRVFDTYTDGNILKVGAVTREDLSPSKDQSGWRASLLGLWNIAERGESTMTAIRDFVDIESVGKEVIVGSFRSQTIFGPFHTIINGPIDASSLIYTTTPVRGWDMLTAYPVLRPLESRLDIAVAVVGLKDKISGAAGVLDVETKVHADGKVLTVKIKLKALGKLGLWTSGLSRETLSNNISKLQGQAIRSQSVEVGDLETVGTDIDQKLLSLDLEAEWRNRGLFETKQGSVAVEIQIALE